MAVLEADLAQRGESSDEVLPSGDQARRVVEEIVSRSGTSFYQGMRILSPERRMAMWAIYAFCRVVDDIADDPAPAEERQAGLDRWRRRIEALYEGRPEDAITVVLADAIAAYKLRQEDFQAVITGMELDAFSEIVGPVLEDLDYYCDCVASAVGRLSVRAFGDDSKRADDVAWSLGRALQFTNILRDLAEDAARDRLYLPGEWLRDAGIPFLPPTEVLARPELPQLCKMMARQAHRYFNSAEGAMRDCDRRAMRPARLMAASYRAVLRRLERRGWTRLDEAVKVPRLLKIWFLLRYGLI